MNWLHKRWLSLSDDRRYELHAQWTGGHFEWRGRVIATDELVAASHDREFVRRRCEEHAASVAAEAGA